MRLWRRVACGGAGILLGGALVVPPGPATTSQSVNQLNNQSTQPLPRVAPPPPAPNTLIWVPPRSVLSPGDPSGVVVPGHWERRTPEGDLYVPSLTAPQPSTGTLQSFPAGPRSPADERIYGP